jgi:hypothetical protein
VTVFLESIAIYLRAWTGAFSAEGRRLAPLGPRRLALLLLAFPAFLALQGLHWAGLWLDELFFPGYRRQRIDRPVFILGVPRSGTTYLHRELARDPGFSTASTWELLLAPSLCEKRLWRGLAAVDARLGAPFAQLLHWALGGPQQAMAQLHPVALDAAEEDYLALLPAAGCFFAHLAFPAAQELALLGDIQTMSRARRTRLLDHYHRLLQRQLYDGGGRQLLSKNAAFASWGAELVRRYPDALLLVCIREPLQALSSQLASLAPARRMLAVDPKGTWMRARFADLYRRWYQQLSELHADAPQQTLVVEQALLREQRQAELARVYRHLDREPPAGAAATALPGAGAGQHDPAGHGLADEVARDMLPAYLKLRAQAALP